MAEKTHENQTIQDATHSKVKELIIAQVLAYVLLIAASFGSGSLGNWFAAAVALVILVLFLVFWPFRGTLLDRIVTAVFGVVSLVCAVGPFAGKWLKDSAATYQTNEWDFWALAAGVLLVILVVFSFARQMLREDRSHLIRALSHAVTSGVAAIAVAGWTFLPNLYALVGKGSVYAIIAVVVIVLLALALGVASYYWLLDADPAPSAVRPWFGIALLPVMILGVTIAVATLLVTVLA